MLSLKPRPINEAICFVSFAHRPNAAGGAFYDYTARYGAVRDEDRVTLRQSMFPEESGFVRDSIESFIVNKSHHKRHDASPRLEARAWRFEELIEKLGLMHLLDLPLVALSNGQTRRARIVKALLEQPDILLLDEPLSTCWVPLSTQCQHVSLTRARFSWIGFQNASNSAFPPSLCSRLQ